MVKKTDFDSKIIEVEGKILNVSSLITKSNFNAKITEIEGKIPDVTSLITKTDFDAELKKISERFASSKSKHLLVENELEKLRKSDSSYFRVKDFLEGNYLVFKPMNKYFKNISNTQSISS